MTNLIFEAFNTGPTAHDEWVISRNHGNHVDTLGLEFVVLLDVRWQVVDMASRLEDDTHV